MIIKKKSLVVALVSSLVILLVMITTLIGYLIYVELKDNESKLSYQALLQKLNAKNYSAYIDASKLNARLGKGGALEKEPIVEGVIVNKGRKAITDILLKVKFKDKDGAVLYEVTFHPQEPPFGSFILTQVSIPYISGPSKVQIKPGDEFAFKRILANCPKEILSAMREGGSWGGKLDAEVLALDFLKTERSI